jgi:uncharacterized protein YgiM (DUF1202 family)
MTVYVNTANKGTLNLRAEPSPSAKVLARIPYHTSLESEYVDNTWSKVTYNDKTGYVKTEFLSNGKAVTRSDLEQIYNSLKSTLETIEKILK